MRRKHLMVCPHYDREADAIRSPTGYIAWNEALLYEAAIDLTWRHGLGVRQEPSLGDCITATAIQALGAMRAPARFISRSLGEALLHTGLKSMPPPEMVWPGIRLFLPDGLLRNQFGDSIPVVRVVDSRALPTYAPPGMTEWLGDMRDHPRILIAAASSMNGSSPGRQHSGILDWGRLSLDLDDVKAVLRVEDDRPPSEELVLAIHRLALNAYLLELSRPALVERDPRLVWRKQDKWLFEQPMAPAWLGRSYRTRTTTTPHTGEAGTGGTVAPHWRKGHMHTVLHGPGRAQRRLQWFEPVMVNAHRLPT